MARPTPSPLLFMALPGVLLAACGDPPALLKDSAEDTEYVYRDTSTVVDTSPDSDTGQDSETAVDTSETSVPDDTYDSDTGDMTSGTLYVYPSHLVVFPGASFPTRVIFEDALGLRTEIDPKAVAWTPSDGSVASVDASGLVTATAAGSITLTATFDGVSADAALDVSGDALLRVTLVDAQTGLPIENGSVSIGDGSRNATDAKGAVAVAASDAGPIHVNAWGRGYVPVSVMDTVSRELVLPLRPVTSLEPAGVDVAGSVDLTSVDPGDYDDLVVGFAASSLMSDPLFFDFESLFGSNRTVSVYGADIRIPSNVYIGGVAESYSSHAEAGAFGIWTLGGPVPIADLLSGFAGTGDLIALVASHLGDFSYDWAGGLVGADGDSLGQDIAPSGSLGESVLTTVPALPAGFVGDESSALFVFDHADDGSYAVVGLGMGDSSVTLRRALTGVVPGATDTVVVSVVQVGGIGSGEAMCMSAGPVEAGSADLGSYLPPPAVNYFYGTSHAYDVNLSEEAELAHIIVTSNEGEVRELYFAGGAHVGTLPAPSYPFSYGRTDWDVMLMHTTEDTFEGIMSAGTYLDDALRGRLESTAAVEDSFTG